MFIYRPKPQQKQQLCIEPRSLAFVMTLPAFAAERRRLSQTSIDNWLYAAPADARARAQQQTSRTQLLLSIDGTDRRTPDR